jgi:hypothetical protein
LLYPSLSPKKVRNIEYLEYKTDNTLHRNSCPTAAATSTTSAACSPCCSAQGAFSCRGDNKPGKLNKQGLAFYGSEIQSTQAAQIDLNQGHEAVAAYDYEVSKFFIIEWIYSPIICIGC